MSDGVTVKIVGVEEAMAALRDVVPQLRRRVLPAALRDGGRIIQRAARANAPVMKSISLSGTRKPGTVRRAISVRTSKEARRRGAVGVFINVRPLRGARQVKLGRAGARNPNDPYYWIFQEFGTKAHRIAPVKGRKGVLRLGAGRFARAVQHPGNRPTRFLTRAGEQAGPEAMQTVIRQVVPQINRMNARLAAKAAR